MGDLSKAALTSAIMDKLQKALTKKDLEIIKYLLKKEKRNEGGTVMKKKKYQRGGFEQGFRAREDESLGMRTGPERAKLQDMAARRADSYGAWGTRPNQMINRKDGGVAAKMIRELLGEGSKNVSSKDIAVIDDILKAAGFEGAIAAGLESAPENKKSKSEVPPHRRNNAKGGVASYRRGGVEESSRTISNVDRAKVDAILAKYTGESSRTISNVDRKTSQEILNQNAKGGFAHGGVKRAGEEGSRLSVSMEKQEDAGFSPSEADFREQHKLALEGVMDVGADVTIVQGHDSREQLGETDGVRGGGAAIRGKNFSGVS